MAFCKSNADIVIYGGAAGGGKSYALLLEAARDIDKPSYRAVLFRKHRPQLIAQGGLVDTAKKIYPHLGGHFKATTLEFIFPSGAVIQFASAADEEEAKKFDGSQLDFVGFDETIHFPEEVIWYLLSRNRSTSGIKTRMRMTTNPGPNSWLKGFLSWWLDGETGYADQAKSGVKRYMVRQEGEIHWFGDKTEADAFAAKITPKEMLEEGQLLKSKSVTFIPSSVTDNKELLKNSPEYMSSLYALDRVERERLLLGNWNVLSGAGTYFRPEWFPVVRAAAATPHKVRFWDTAGTEAGGDWTVGTLMSRTAAGFYTVEDVVRGQWSPKGVEDAIRNTASQDGRDVIIGIEQESGASGKSAASYMVRQLAGYKVKLVPSSSSKVERAKPLSAQVEAGNVSLVEGNWNKPFVDELYNYSGEESTKTRKDDQVDSASGAFHLLNKTRPAIYAPVHSLRK